MSIDQWSAARRSPRSARVRLLAAALAVLALVVPTAPATAATLEARVRAVLATLPRGTTAAVVAAPAEGGAPLVAIQPDRPLKPASVMKLLTTAAALERFGPDFELTTRLYYLDGELIVVGGGDPAFGDPELAARDHRDWDHVYDAWAQALSARGIRQISKLVLDDSIFDQQTRHPDWDVDQSQRAYAAPVGGLNVFENCVDFSVKPRADDVLIIAEPRLPMTFIDHRVRRDSRHRVIVHRRPDSDVFELKGKAARAAEVGTASANRPTVFFGYVTKTALGQRGIVIDGAVVRRHLTDAERGAAGLIATHSTPLRDLVWRANTFSQNLFAECLLKSLAAYATDGARAAAPASFDTGAAVLRRQLARLGVDLEGAVIRDGSGLSHDNRLTARQVTVLLQQMATHAHAALYRDSLADPGEAGTLERRDNPRLLGRLDAKTGTLRHVRALAGYLERPDGGTLAFAVLIQGPSKSTAPLAVAEALLGD